MCFVCLTVPVLLHLWSCDGQVNCPGCPPPPFPLSTLLSRPPSLPSLDDGTRVVENVDQLSTRLTPTATHLTVPSAGLINLARNACEQSYHRHPDVPQPVCLHTPSTHTQTLLSPIPYSGSAAACGRVSVDYIFFLLPSQSSKGALTLCSLIASGHHRI